MLKSKYDCNKFIGSDARHEIQIFRDHKCAGSPKDVGEFT
jgi:hypothetical protein